MALVAAREEPPSHLVVEQVGAGAVDIAENRQVPEPGNRQGGRTGKSDAANRSPRTQPAIDDHEHQQCGQLDEHRRAFGEQAQARGESGEEPRRVSGCCTRGP